MHGVEDVFPLHPNVQAPLLAAVAELLGQLGKGRLISPHTEAMMPTWSLPTTVIMALMKIPPYSSGYSPAVYAI